MTLPLPFQFGPDFTNFLLPWIFTFAIVYGLLMKAEIFGSVNQKVSVALAFVIAFFVSAVGGPQLGAFFTSLFGGASTFLAGILVVALFVAMIGMKLSEKANAMALGIVVLLGVILFLAAQGNISGFRLDQNTTSLIFWAVVVLAVIYYVAHGTGGTDKGAAAATKPPGT
ncbi:MAG: hypothetical protein HYT72_01965 [Candidatus Aenigmarchaeota archaeon]|nr:hypothetical protein [Candidatus Aenigmarchaeota archaeon]